MLHDQTYSLIGPLSRTISFVLLCQNVALSTEPSTGRLVISSKPSENKYIPDVICRAGREDVTETLCTL